MKSVACDGVNGTLCQLGLVRVRHGLEKIFVAWKRESLTCVDRWYRRKVLVVQRSQESIRSTNLAKFIVSLYELAAVDTTMNCSHFSAGEDKRMSTTSLHIDVDNSFLNEAVFPTFARDLLDLGSIGLEVGMSNLRTQECRSENAFLSDIPVHDREVEPLLNWKPQLCRTAITKADIGHLKSPWQS
jgi:hypothetical protein